MNSYFFGTRVVYSSTFMKKILIIEDDADLLSIYQDELSKSGYQVFNATTAVLGLQIAKTELPHLVILDLMIPGHLNGMAVLKKFKSTKSLKHIPIVVITNLESEKEMAMKEGAADYIIKANITLEQLVTRVKQSIHTN